MNPKRLFSQWSQGNPGSQGPLVRNQLLFGLCLTLLGASGCTIDDPLDGFSGVWQTRNKRVYAVAHFEHFQLPLYKGEINTIVHPVLGDAVGQKLKMSLNWFKRTITVDFPALSPAPVELKIVSESKEKNCGEGKAHGNRVDFCYGYGEISLNVKDTHGGLVLGLNLQRGIDFSNPESRAITLNEAVGRARFSDYRVRQAAERVYRAREEIQVAKAKLYPKFSGRTILSMGLAASNSAVTGWAIFDIADNFLPFVFPMNWFRVGMVKEQFQAEVASLKSLQANQMLAMEGMFYSIEKDLEVFKVIESRLERLKDKRDIVVRRNQVGQVSDLDVAAINQSVKKNELELSEFRATVLNLQLASFARALALSPMRGEPMTLIPSRKYGIDELDKVFPENLEKDLAQARKNSLEIQVLDHLKLAAKEQLKVAQWSFIAPGSGIFVDTSYIAVQRLATSTEHEVETKIEESAQMLEENIIQISEKYNAALDNYFYWLVYSRDLQNSLVAQERSDQFSANRIEDRDSVLNDILKAQVGMLESRAAVLTNRAAYQRLKLSGSFSRVLKETDTD